MKKFDRNYRLEFDVGEAGKSASGGYDFKNPSFTETIEVDYPLTLNLAVNRDTYSQVNTGYFQILGLNERTRTKLYKDRDDAKKFINCRLMAGYGDNLSLCFSGTVKECFSVKDSGATEYKTEIEAWDGGFAIYWAHTNRTLGGNVKGTDILNLLTSDFQIVELGGVSNTLEIPTTDRDQSFIGRTWDCLRQYVNGNLFIDNGKLYIMDVENDVRQGELMELNVDSGLLSSPRRRDKVLEVELLFEPRVVVGQQIVLNSSTVPYLNGTYKIIGINHSGVISGAVGGKLTTKLALFIGNKIFRNIKELNINAA